MIITRAMPAQHFSGVSHHRHRSQHVDHDFAGAVRSQPGGKLVRTSSGLVPTVKPDQTETLPRR